MQPLDVLKHSPLFSGVDSKALREMADALVIERYPKGCDILPHAATVDRFFVLSRGRVKVTRSNVAA